MSKKSTNLSEKAGVVVFARIVTTVIDLAIVIATIQILSKTDFAIIGYLLMIHEVARNLATLGFPDSVFYFFERVSGSAKRAFVNQTTLILLGTALIAGIFILLVGYFAPSFLTEWSPDSIEQVQHLLPFMALVAVFEIPTWPVTNILLALDRQKESAWYEMITSLLTFLLLVGPLALGYALDIAVYGLVAYGLIRFIGSWVWMRVVLPEGKLSDSEISVRRQVNFSLPLGLSALVNKINRYVDKFVVSILLPVTAYAEYTIGAQEVPIIRVIPFAVGSVLISRYVEFQLESKKEELLELWYKGVQKVSLLVVPLTILSIIIASDLIAIIAESEGTSYRNAVLPFQIYNLIVLVRVTHYGSILQAFGDTRGVFYLSINLVVANLILSIPLTMLYGINGTALGTLIANLYNWYITLRRIGTHMELPARKVLPFPYYLKVLGVSVLTAVPIWYGRYILISEANSVLGLLISIITYLLLFSILGTLLKVITSDDWSQLKNWLQLKFLSRN
ncbi:oligosaccharide flippase family protein [Rhodohalobacter sulfatireducens]|uniref:Oligosaccharide flippase family protein n=1 Tax=Rhodohalobacter sulfatireducens TaxID=2911366 RepID=A0ABS9KI47_9BACT|nr:oligosaccharide flippase family protein [Rhodohalobacter sulfatireducens]MCG2590505.1 oligosaccharide flippase family protein [Rhodohalobacter sulfatireducens]